MVKKTYKKTYKKKVYKRKSNFARLVRPNDLTTVRLRVVGYSDLNTANPATDITMCFPLNAPLYYGSTGAAVPTTTAFALLPILPSNVKWTQALSYWDSYRVHSVMFTFLSRMIDTSLQISANDFPNMVWHMNDPDDMATNTENTFMDRGRTPLPLNQGLHNGKFLTCRYVQPKQDRNTWLNVSNVAIAPSTATTSSTNLSPLHYKSLKVCYPHNANALNLGRIMVTWDVEFKAMI